MSIEIKGTVEDIIFKNEENGFVIAVVDFEDEMLYVKGYMPFITEGDTVKFKGKMVTHPVYGEQFDVEHCEQVLPTTVEAIEKYLASGLITGIGPSTAKKIVEKFGEESLDIITYNPQRLAEVSGIGESKVEIIALSFSEQRAIKDVMMFLQKYDVSTAYATKIYKFYGEHTIQILSENPYRMADEIDGIGFKMADAIAQKMGVEIASPYRLATGLKHVLELFSHNGHSYAYREELVTKATEILGVGREQLESELIELVIRGELFHDIIEDQDAVYLSRLFYAEQNVLRRLLEMDSSRYNMKSGDVELIVNEYEENEGIDLAEEQREAVGAVVENGILVITGGPGTGKTTIINGIIQVFEAKKMKVLLAAPTGRAAKRMAEATSREAKTIHRLLEYAYSEDENSIGFNKNETDPLVADAVIIDEVSMVDIVLMSRLMDALTPGTRLILVGDSDQLPSVGPGNVLKDLIESDVFKVVKLKEIFRQAEESMIVVNAHRINNGERLLVNEKDKDFFLITKRRHEDILETIRNLCKERLPNFYKLNGKADIQVLSPTKNGIIGTVSLNKTLQEALNPPASHKIERRFNDKLFRVGDKVMQIKNNYNIKWENKDGYEGEGIYNGDIGLVDFIDVNEREIHIIFDGDKTAVYEFNQADELVLAYAVTVHKSQGSEFPVIVMPASWGPPMLMNRNIIYTAVTRAKQLVVLVGEERYVNHMIDNSKILDRRSGLLNRLKMIKSELIDV